MPTLKYDVNELKALQEKIKRLESHQYIYFRQALLRLTATIKSSSSAADTTRVIQLTSKLIDDIRNILTDDEAQQLFALYEKNCFPLKVGSLVKKSVCTVIITGICAFVGIPVGIILGAAAGFLLGMPTGPGAIVSGLSGALAGGVGGVSLSLSAGGALTALIFGALLTSSVFGAAGLSYRLTRFFKPNPLKFAVKKVSRQMQVSQTDIAQEESINSKLKAIEEQIKQSSTRNQELVITSLQTCPVKIQI